MLSTSVGATKPAPRTNTRARPVDIGRLIAQLADLEDFAVANELGQTLFTDTILVTGVEPDGRIIIGTASGEEFEITIKAR